MPVVLGSREGADVRLQFVRRTRHGVAIQHEAQVAYADLVRAVADACERDARLLSDDGYADDAAELSRLGRSLSSRNSGRPPGVSNAMSVLKPERILACDMSALTKEQRARHVAMTKLLLQHAVRTDLADGYLFTVERTQVSVADLAQWVADESRCCPAVDFHVELPAFGPLTLRMDGGADVKAFLAIELGL